MFLMAIAILGKKGGVGNRGREYVALLPVAYWQR
jgi:hypothetical protein